MRNFYVRTTADGVTSPKGTGPVGKDGGFHTIITGKIHNKEVVLFDIYGWVNDEEERRITIEDTNKNRIADETFG